MYEQGWRKGAKSVCSQYCLHINWYGSADPDPEWDPPTLSLVRNTAQGQPNMPSALWLLKPSTGTYRKFDGSTENTSAATEINTYGTYTGGKLSEPSLASIAVPVGCRYWTNLSTLIHVGDGERGRALPLCAPLTRRVGGSVGKAGAAVVALRQMRSTKKKKRVKFWNKRGEPGKGVNKK